MMKITLPTRWKRCVPTCGGHDGVVLVAAAAVYISPTQSLPQRLLAV